MADVDQAAEAAERDPSVTYDPGTPALEPDEYAPPNEEPQSAHEYIVVHGSVSGVVVGTFDSEESVLAHRAEIGEVDHPVTVAALRDSAGGTGSDYVIVHGTLDGEIVGAFDNETAANAHRESKVAEEPGHPVTVVQLRHPNEHSPDG